MKHKVWLHHLIGAIFAFVLSVSAVGNLITGYSLPIESLWRIVLWCAIFALVTSVVFRLRYGGWILLCIAAICSLMLWCNETAWQQMQQQMECLSYILTRHYHTVYNWPVFGNPIANNVSLPLILWTALVATCVNWYFCRRKHIIIAILPAVIPLILCLFTTDRVPDLIYLYQIILAVAVLLVSDWTRKRYPTQALRLLLRVVLPIATSLALLFALNPREGYVNQAGKFQKEIMSRFQELQNATESAVSGVPITAPASEKLNLRNVGPKSKISHSVMRVNSPIGGTLYLRGRDYDQYTGTGWEASSGRTEQFTSGGDSAGELTIVTYGVRDVLYVPYYAAKKINLIGGAIENEDNLQRYSYYLSRKAQQNTLNPDSRYTDLPENTHQWAKELLKEILDGTEADEEVIRLIQNYVRSSAIYDLSTPRMDSNYSDFAQWFLEESDSGYCVHFASAATVLLRAAGIPARYVEGYMIDCNPAAAVVVSNQDAHAWAEYYDSANNAWRILEATPADLEDEEIESTMTMLETESQHDETQAETDSSVTEPDAPELVPTKPLLTQDEAPEKTDTPSENTVSQDEGMEFLKIIAWIRPMFNCLIIACCIPLQAHLRICRKRKLWNCGRANERTLTRWGQTRSLAKLLKQEYPEELDRLAQKAKFSQHKIRPEELQLFDDYRNMLCEQMRSMPWYHRIVYKWILAIDS